MAVTRAIKRSGRWRERGRRSASKDRPPSNETRILITRKVPYVPVGEEQLAATGAIAALKQRKKRKQKADELEERVRKLEEEVAKLKQRLDHPD